MLHTILWRNLNDILNFFITYYYIFSSNIIPWPTFTTYFIMIHITNWHFYQHIILWYFLHILYYNDLSHTILWHFNYHILYCDNFIQILYFVTSHTILLYMYECFFHYVLHYYTCFKWNMARTLWGSELCWSCGSVVNQLPSWVRSTSSVVTVRLFYSNHTVLKLLFLELYNSFQYN